ncbi:nitroreductase family protein [Selenomonas sp. F0473]|uniref:nitroreductase family protein n=1 Tax=Selenomonas sp. F0473 TaxID=999423 RepID=UPI0025CC8B36|nr:nitroreductase family protein [Selenomonas sp. F0473]
MEFNELIKERFSCRALSDKEIPHDATGRIFEAARLAPTAVNKQPFKVWAVQSPAARAKLAETTKYTFGAGLFLVVGGKADEAWVRQYDERNFADVDAAIAATHIMLAIHNEGLASTWVGHFDAPKLKEFFPEMADYDLIAIFPVGYPAEQGVPSPRHTVRKGATEIVKVL